MNLPKIVRDRLNRLASDMPADWADVLRCEAQAMSAVVEEALRIRDEQAKAVVASRRNWRKLALMFATFSLVLLTIALVRCSQ